MILSLVTGAISVANASAFILLNPGPELIQYFSASAVYSLFVWIILWIVPSTWGFRIADIAIVRQSQLLVGLAGAAIILATHPTPIGAAFAALLLLDMLIFYNFPLMYADETLKTQSIDFIRACLAVSALAMALFLFDGSPTRFALILVVLTVGMAIALRWSGWHRAALPTLTAAPVGTVFRDVLVAFRQKALQAFLASRFLEIGTLFALGHLQQLGMLVAFKLGLAMTNTLSSNGRRYRPITLFLVLNGLYGILLVAIRAMEQWVPALLPATLSTIGWRDVLVGLPMANLCFAATLAGIRSR